MWSRGDLKEYSKNFLRGNYWKAFIVCFISVTIFAGGGGSQFLRLQDNQIFKIQSYDNYIGGETYMDEDGNTVNYSGKIVDNSSPENGDKFVLEIDNIFIRLFTGNMDNPIIWYISYSSVITTAIIVGIVGITIGYVIDVGKSRFFLKGFERGEGEVSDLFSGFNRQEYFGIVKTQFLRGLYTLLWTFVLIIPGIIKGYEYKFVPYILANEPNMSSNEAIKRSSELTDGHKWNMFVLELSFVLWYLAGFVLLGIGTIFVDPYVEATFAKLYVELADEHKYKYGYRDETIDRDDIIIE